MIGFVVLGALGCSEDAAPPTPPPPAELELIAPGNVSGVPPCVRRGSDVRQSIVAQVSVRNFRLAPPGSCTVNECGTVRFMLGSRTFESAQRFTSLPTLELPDGRHSIEATLFDAKGELHLASDHEDCIGCRRTFVLDPACGEVEPEPPPEPSPDPSGSGSDAGTAMLVDAGGSADSGLGGSGPTVDGGPAASEAGLADAGFGGGVPEALEAGIDVDGGSQGFDAAVDGREAGSSGGSVGADAGPGSRPDAAAPVAAP